MASGISGLLVSLAYLGGPARRSLAAGSLIIAVASAAPAAEPTLQGCRAVALIDQAGSRVVGVEDLALDGAGDRLLLSAYDRRSGSEGGIHAWPLASLDAPRPTVRRLRMKDLPPGGFRPHGFAAVGGRLAVVNRTDQGPVVDRFAIGEQSLRHVARAVDPRLCGANDVAFRGGSLLASIDREACGGPALWRERVFNQPRGSILALADGAVAVVQGGLRFPNGLIADHDLALVAETRAFAVRDIVAGTATPLPFAPDNLTRGEAGAVWAAGPERLWRFALYIGGWSAAAGPSLVARLDGPSAPLVYRVPTGLIEGATAALAARGRLVVAAGWDDRVAVCKLPLSPDR